MSEDLQRFDAHFKELSDLESVVPTDLFDRLQAKRTDSLSPDTSLRNSLNAYNSPITATLFDKIMAERDSRRNRTIFFWRWSAAAALALFFMAAIVKYSIGNSEFNIPKNTNIVQNPRENGQKDVEIAKNDVNTEGGHKSYETENTSLNNEKNHPTKSDKAVDIKSKMSVTDIVIQRNKQDIINKNNSPIFHIAPISKQPKGQQNVAPTNRSLDTNNSGENALSYTSTEASVFTPKAGENNINQAEIHAQRPVSNTQTVDFLPLITTQKLDISSVKLQKPCTGPGDDCYSFGGQKRRGMGEKTFYIDAYGAPDYAFRHLNVNLPENEGLLTARNTSEKSQYAWRAGVRASLVFENGLAFRTGVTYSQIHEKATFDSLGIGKILVTYDIRIVNGMRDTVSVTTVVTSGIFRKTRYNQYRSLDIPLQVGYEVPLSSKWTFGINGGVNFNIAAWRKADIVGYDLKKQDASSGINEPNPVFRTTLGVSLFGSVAAYRQLSDNLQLVIEPSVIHALTPMTRADYGLKQSYTTAGLMIGLRLKL